MQHSFHQRLFRPAKSLCAVPQTLGGIRAVRTLTLHLCSLRPRTAANRRSVVRENASNRYEEPRTVAKRCLMLRSMVTSILCWVFREAEKLRCGVVTKDQWRLPRRNCWDSSGLDSGNPMSRSAAGHNSHTTACNQLILEVLKCRRGDLNPHGTRSRQILSLLRMPISPLICERLNFSTAS